MKTESSEDNIDHLVYCDNTGKVGERVLNKIKSGTKSRMLLWGQAFRIIMKNRGFDMRLKLIRPSFEYAEQVMQYKEAMLKSGDRFDGCAGLEEADSFSEWIDFENRLKLKYGDGFVPSEVFLCVRLEDDKVVGIIDYRHPLSPFLLQYSGNIGYSILPSERQKGYAKEMLRLMLPICKSFGEKKILLTCDKTNVASQKTIVANGGIFENDIKDTVGLSQSGIIERYWILL